MIFCMIFGRFIGVIFSLFCMAGCGMCMVSCFFMVSGFVLFCRFGVVLCSFFVVLCSLFMMIVFHGFFVLGYCLVVKILRRFGKVECPVPVKCMPGRMRRKLAVIHILLEKKEDFNRQMDPENNTSAPDDVWKKIII